MRRIYEEWHWVSSGGMIYIPSFMMIGSDIQVMLNLLPQQFDRLQCWYYSWEEFMKYALRWPLMTWYAYQVSQWSVQAVQWYKFIVSTIWEAAMLVLVVFQHTQSSIHMLLYSLKKIKVLDWVTSHYFFHSLVNDRIVTSQSIFELTKQVIEDVRSGQYRGCFITSKFSWHRLSVVLAAMC
jgi:hypothetical protein